ncbi:MAG: Gx transporter family protein [Dissulfurispiraceae bacterium]|jgi:heptaprenyl diphosphate synthase|nr:Gx transporter family protein [Dissulfurispiraceae bacterium]
MLSQDSCRIAILSAFALALHAAEAMLPSPIPWIKPGFSNIIALIALYLFGFKTALYVTLIRVTAGSMLLGTFPGPAFALSLTGGLAGITSMAIVLNIIPRLFSPVGISVIGALFHNATQLITAYALFIHRLEPVVIAAPVLMLIGTATGLLNGVICRYLLYRMQ